MSRVKFYPQVWDGPYAIPVDVDGRDDEWEVGEIPPGVESFTYESDDLRYHPNAPEWVREWHGPFEVEILPEPVTPHDGGA